MMMMMMIASTSGDKDGGESGEKKTTMTTMIGVERDMRGRESVNMSTEKVTIVPGMIGVGNGVTSQGRDGATGEKTTSMRMIGADLRSQGQDEATEENEGSGTKRKTLVVDPGNGGREVSENS